MNFFTSCLKGIAIGAGAILPGISSGVLCVIFGIYEKLLNSVLNFFKDIKNNFKFLAPIFTGCFIGVVLFGRILNFLLYKFPIQTNSLFIGFILESIFCLVKKVKFSYGVNFKYILCFLLALLIGIGSFLLEKFCPVFFGNSENISFLYLVLCGFMMSAGIVVPGVSSTIILMLLGIYSVYLSSISNLYLPVILPIGIGLILGGFLLMKIIKYLLDNHYAPTFFSIIGFSLGSIFVLIPSYSSFIDVIIGLLCILIGFFAASSLNSKKIV